MKIPSKFTLGGITWTVAQVETIPNAYGVTTYDHSKIEILKTLPKQFKEQVFLHELGHAVLYSMGKPMPHDEEFVDAYATFLHQYLLTAE